MPIRPKSHYELEREKHRKQYDKARRSIQDGFYQSAAWIHLRQEQLSLYPLCAICEKQNRTTAATEVHHKIERAKRADLELTLSNLESLCRTCHSRLSPTLFGRGYQSRSEPQTIVDGSIEGGKRLKTAPSLCQSEIRFFRSE